MRIIRQSATELVVKDSSVWMSVLCIGGALAVGCFAWMKGEPKSLFVTAFFLLFAAIAARATTCTFDALEQVVRWRGFRLFKTSSGTVRFEDIRDITVEAMSMDKSGMTYRLVLQTAQGPVPLANAYSGSSDGYAKLRREILAFIRPGLDAAIAPSAGVDGIPADLESSIRTLLDQQRVMDATVLLRARERISLTEAKKRIGQVRSQMQREN